jgi:2-desacetyl-2-hydroxyethyl bacteriochlorophyllide A dehydrogenase
MKAAVFTGSGKFRIIDKRKPFLKENEVLLKVSYAGICGTDKKILTKKINAKTRILGHEFSGKAVKLGSRVRNIKIGQFYNVQPNKNCRACMLCKTNRGCLCDKKLSYGIDLDGGLAEYCVVDKHCLCKISRTNLEQSVLIEPLACCLNGLSRCDFSSVNRVLIIGGGFIGLTFLQLIKLRGSEVHLAELSKKKRRIAKKLGADQIFNSDKNVNDKYHYDLIIEAVGKKTTIESCLRLMGKSTQLLQFGVAPLKYQVKLYPYQIFANELRIIGSRSNACDHSEAVKLLPKLKMDNLITNIVDFKDINKAFNLAKKKDTIKIVLKIGG